ncbi:uncharacterized protein LOC111340474 [Stylophora pistillata]|uniref:uncharacterized protein LOC111340474 n=1 Tax=Stylophora pistillata TaxID=50429 RepID=UPI000C04DE61|nr:uncharacterized protein LOC111340474 [Stylophora pistillata]
MAEGGEADYPTTDSNSDVPVDDFSNSENDSHFSEDSSADYRVENLSNKSRNIILMGPKRSSSLTKPLSICTQMEPRNVHLVTALYRKLRWMASEPLNSQVDMGRHKRNSIKKENTPTGQSRRCIPMVAQRPVILRDGCRSKDREVRVLVDSSHQDR